MDGVSHAAGGAAGSAAGAADAGKHTVLVGGATLRSATAAAAVAAASSSPGQKARLRSRMGRRGSKGSSGGILRSFDKIRAIMEGQVQPQEEQEVWSRGRGQRRRQAPRQARPTAAATTTLGSATAVSGSSGATAKLPRAPVNTENVVKVVKVKKPDVRRPAVSSLASLGGGAWEAGRGELVGSVLGAVMCPFVCGPTAGSSTDAAMTMELLLLLPSIADLTTSVEVQVKEQQALGGEPLPHATPVGTAASARERLRSLNIPHSLRAVAAVFRESRAAEAAAQYYQYPNLHAGCLTSVGGGFPQATPAALWVAPAATAGTPVSMHAVVQVAATASAAIESLALHPLDVWKTRAQLLPALSASPGGGGGGVASSLLETWGREGASAFYRGVAPAVAGAVARCTLRVRLYPALLDSAEASGEIKGALAPALCGAAVGAVEALAIVTPLDALKIRAQAAGLGVELGGGAHDAPATRSILWAAWKPTLLRQCGAHAAGFTVFAACNGALAEGGCMEWFGRRLPWASRHDHTYSTGKTVGCGLVAGAVAAVITNPVDVIKTRWMAAAAAGVPLGAAQGAAQGMQGVDAIRRAHLGLPPPPPTAFSMSTAALPFGGPGSVSASSHTGGSVLRACAEVVRSEGAAALWAGCKARMVRLAVGQALTWTLVARTTQYFDAPTQAAWRHQSLEMQRVNV